MDDKIGEQEVITEPVTEEIKDTLTDVVEYKSDAKSKEVEAENLELNNLLETYKTELEKVMFLIDPIKFNSTMYQGIQIILNKLETIEKKLDELKK